MLNLLSNAFKYTLEGEIRVELSGTLESIQLTVRDTGIGIDSDAKSHLFERFYRVPGAKGRAYEGSGIGLSLVAELVKQHSGSIRVESAPGQGSCFTVTIPGGKAHLPVDQLAAETGNAQASKAHAFIEEARHWAASEDIESKSTECRCPRCSPLC